MYCPHPSNWVTVMSEIQSHKARSQLGLGICLLPQAGWICPLQHISSSVFCGIWAITKT